MSSRKQEKRGLLLKWQKVIVAHNLSLFTVQDSPSEAVIQRDVNRTFPAHDFFKESGGLGQDSLYRISKVGFPVLFQFHSCKLWAHPEAW